MRLLITEHESFSPAALDLLRGGGFDVVLYPGPLDGIAPHLPGVAGVLVKLGIHWDAALLRAAPDLKFIATQTTGLSHIDAAAAANAGVEIVSLGGLPGMDDISSTAEHAFGLLLALARQVSPAFDDVKAGRWDRRGFVGRELRGKTAGVVGLGRLGRMFAGMAAAFGMDVIYADPHVRERRYRRCGALAELAREADVVSLHAVLNGETRGLLGADFFRACARGPFFVNTARGELVDEAALLAALVEGRIAGAALDVLAGEPGTGAPVASPLVAYARTHPNLLITPHLGGATWDAMRQTEEILAREVVRRYGRSASAPTGAGGLSSTGSCSGSHKEEGEDAR